MSTGDDEPAASAANTQQARRGLAGGRGKKIIMIAPVLVVVLAAAWFMFLKPSGSASKEPPKPVPGAVVTIDAITINLAGGHFLKLGLALQAEAKAKEEPDGAKALDAAIALHSGMTIQELSSKHGREKTKAELVKEVTELYEEEVYDIYSTEFVYQ